MVKGCLCFVLFVLFSLAPAFFVIDHMPSNEYASQSSDTDNDLQHVHLPSTTKDIGDIDEAFDKSPMAFSGSKSSAVESSELNSSISEEASSAPKFSKAFPLFVEPGCSGLVKPKVINRGFAGHDKSISLEVHGTNGESEQSQQPEKDEEVKGYDSVEESHFEQDAGVEEQSQTDQDISTEEPHIEQHTNFEEQYAEQESSKSNVKHMSKHNGVFDDLQPSGHDEESEEEAFRQHKRREESNDFGEYVDEIDHGEEHSMEKMSSGTKMSFSTNPKVEKVAQSLSTPQTDITKDTSLDHWKPLNLGGTKMEFGSFIDNTLQSDGTMNQYTSDQAYAPSQGQTLWYTVRAIFQNNALSGVNSPFGLDEDPFYGAGIIGAIDYESSLQLAIILTNTRVYALYSRLPYSKAFFNRYCPFTYLVPIGYRSPHAYNTYSLAFCQRQKAVAYIMDEKVLLRLRRIGKPIDKKFRVSRSDYEWSFHLKAWPRQFYFVVGTNCVFDEGFNTACQQTVFDQTDPGQNVRDAVKTICTYAPRQDPSEFQVDMLMTIEKSSIYIMPDEDKIFPL